MENKEDLPDDFNLLCSRIMFKLGGIDSKISHMVQLLDSMDKREIRINEELKKINREIRNEIYSHEGEITFSD